MSSTQASSTQASSTQASSTQVINKDGLLTYTDDTYLTAPDAASHFLRLFPTLNFYRKFSWNVFRSSLVARRGKYDEAEWSRTSHEVFKSLEAVGVRTEINGVEQIRNLDSPCVFVANHMSMMETMVLPAIIQPICDVTFVVKQSLMDYPLFRHIVRARDPIAVTRTNSRQDFKTVMQDGSERLKKGISIVVFPQTTRSLKFDSSNFNTIGVKLALRTKVPVIPIALKTDAWGNGKWLKDLGRIHPDKAVHFAFGEPITIEGRGSQQQQDVIRFIQSKLNEWDED